MLQSMGLHGIGHDLVTEQQHLLFAGFNFPVNCLLFTTALSGEVTHLQFIGLAKKICSGSHEIAYEKPE